MLILGICSIIISVYLLFKPYLPASLFAYLSLWFFYWGQFIYLSSDFFIWWGVITMITIGLGVLQGRRLQPFMAALYMVLGGICGMLIGLTVEDYWLIPAGTLGTLMGTLAYAKTRSGRDILFSGSSFIKYFCVYGLRIIVVMSMLGYIYICYVKTNNLHLIQ